ncbi:hypothetical protein SGPA1_10265 [Streptomyces misionensis JCM 4497]
MEVGRPAGDAAGADLVPEVDAAEHLRLRLLGPADDRAAHHRLGQASGAPGALRPGRTAHRPGRPQPGQAHRAAGQLGRRLPAPGQGAPAAAQGGPAPGPQGRDERRRPLDHRAAGERRLLGRHPAPGRVLDHRPAPARLRPRTPGAARGTRLAGPVRRVARGRRADDRGVPVPGVGHLPRHHRAGRRRTARRPPATGEGGRLAARRGDRPARRLVRTPPPTAAGRLGVRVPQRQLPGHRRHRRGLPRAAPGPPPRPRAGRPVHRPRGALEPRHAVARRRVGRLRRRQHQPVPQPAAVLRLRRGHRPAVRGRHRARRGDAGRRGPGRRPAHPARHRLAARRTGGERRLVRPLGRQLHLRHRLGGPRAHRGRTARLAPRDPAGGGLAGVGAERRRRLGRGPALLQARPGMVRPGRLHPLADRVGADGAARGGGEGLRGRGAGRQVAGGQPARGRHLGRAVLHRHRLPLGLLHQLPPVPPGVPAHRPRPVSARRPLRAAAARQDHPVRDRADRAGRTGRVVALRGQGELM